MVARTVNFPRELVVRVPLKNLAPLSLSLVASGLANKQIARRLGIWEKTVKTHLTNVFQRIGVADWTQAALWAERHGLLASKR